MSATAHAATLARMTDEAAETRGSAIKRRMEALGMGASDLAQEAGISRGQVYRVFRDEENLREQSYVACERALDRIEYEVGHGGPEAILSTGSGLIEFEVTGDFGVRVVVKGPIENAAELEHSVARLIRDIRENRND